MLNLSVKVVALGVPWVSGRLDHIQDFWMQGIKFSFSEVNADLAALEMQAFRQYDAVLDTPVVNRWKDSSFDLTVLCAPYVIGPRDFKEEILMWSDSTGAKPRVSVFGLQDKNVLEVFSNEHDASTVNGIDLGPAFELWLNHEISHYLYWKYVPGVDNTHTYFYSGHPELARNQLLNYLPA